MESIAQERAASTPPLCDAKSAAITISYDSSAKSTDAPKLLTFSSFAALADHLNSCPAAPPGKDPNQPWFSPAVFEPRPRRGQSPVWSCFVADFDKGAPPKELERYERIVYESRNSTPEAPRWRWLVLTTEPIPSADVPDVAALFEGADPKAALPTQVFFHRKQGTLAQHLPGKAFNWRMMLEVVGRLSGQPTKPESQETRVAEASGKPHALIREDIRELLAYVADNKDRPAWLKTLWAARRAYHAAAVFTDESGWLEELAEWSLPGWNPKGPFDSCADEVRTKFIEADDRVDGPGIGYLWNRALEGGFLPTAEQHARLHNEKPVIDSFDVLTSGTSPDGPLPFGDEQIAPCELPPCLIDRLIEQNSEVLLFGEQGSYKSLFATEAAVCVATGTSFFGRETMHGLAVSLVGEGAGGARRRVRALQLARGLKSIGALRIEDEAVNFWQQQSRARLIERIRRAEEQTGKKLALLLIDTYSRYAAGSNSRAPADEQLYDWLRCVKHVRGNATVIVVHHTGHDGTHARGTSAWDQATDTVFKAEASGTTRVFTNMKQKDGELAPPMAFTLQTVDTGFTRRRLNGSVEPVSSVALERAEMPTQAPTRRKLGSTEQIVLEVVRNLKPIDAAGPIPVEAILKEAKNKLPHDPEERDVRRQHANRALKALAGKHKLLRIENDHVFLE